MRDNYSVGFIIEFNRESNKIGCFVMETGKSDWIRPEHLKKLSVTDSESYDTNEKLSLIRELYFVKDNEGRLDSARIDTSPGAEVMYQQKTYNVVSVDGPRVVIENDEGSMLVDQASLQAGRQTIAKTPNTTPGYDNRFLTTGSFVWLPITAKESALYPKAEVCLAVISYFNGQDAICYKTYDGSNVEISKWRLQEVDPEIVNILAKNRKYAKFRVKAGEANSNIVDFACPKFEGLNFGDIAGYDIKYVEREEPTVTGGGAEGLVLPGNPLIVRTHAPFDPKDSSGSILMVGLGLAAAAALVILMTR
jgi:hypothetical protein